MKCVMYSGVLGRALLVCSVMFLALGVSLPSAFAESRNQPDVHSGAGTTVQLEPLGGAGDLNALAASANKEITAMRAALKRSQSGLDDARKDKDIMRVNCINERLTALKGLLKISETAELSLQAAVSGKDAGAANHEHTKISIASQKIRQLDAEIQNCMGEMAQYTGETELKVETTDEIPRFDPTANLGADMLTGTGSSDNSGSAEDSNPQGYTASGYQ